MKDTLEYKILKHLKENDNGDFIDMMGFLDDRKLLESKLRSLSKEPEKYISARFPFFIVGGGQPDFRDDKLQAKIEFKGIKYLNEIENKNNSIVNNLNNYGNNYGIQSSNSDLIKPTIQTKVKTTRKEPRKKSWIEILYWVIGIIVGMTILYEFFLKSLF